MIITIIIIIIIIIVVVIIKIIMIIIMNTDYKNDEIVSIVMVFFTYRLFKPDQQAGCEGSGRSG